MFTGIVEEIGRIRSVEPVGDGRQLVVAAQVVLADMSIGTSVAVDGCCLTVTGLGADWFSVDAVPETIQRTTFGVVGPGELVNLERPLPVEGRFGGHIVQGHVDAVAEVVAVETQSDGSHVLTFSQPESLLGQIVEKGSVALAGVSLTVAGVDSVLAGVGGAVFYVALIPHTLEVTTFGNRVVGDHVNIEADILARYVAGLLSVGFPMGTGSQERVV